MYLAQTAAPAFSLGGTSPGRSLQDTILNKLTRLARLEIEINAPQAKDRQRIDSLFPLMTPDPNLRLPDWYVRSYLHSHRQQAWPGAQFLECCLVLAFGCMAFGLKWSRGTSWNDGQGDSAFLEEAGSFANFATEWQSALPVTRHCLVPFYFGAGSAICLHLPRRCEVCGFKLLLDDIQKSAVVQHHPGRSPSAYAARWNKRLGKQSSGRVECYV